MTTQVLSASQDWPANPTNVLWIERFACAWKAYRTQKLLKALSSEQQKDIGFRTNPVTTLKITDWS